MKHIITISLLLLTILPSCVVQDRSSWLNKDTWYNAPTDETIVPWKWDEKQYSEVKPTSQNEAQLLLDTKQIINIPSHQASHFVEQKLQNITGNYYLVRGVFLNEGTGSFSIYAKEKQLWVYHGSLGHSAVEMKRKALIVALEEIPNEIFVTCSMDE